MKKWLSAIILFFCLFFLTGANFVVYPSSLTCTQANHKPSSQNDPQGPVEEKPGTGCNAGLSVQEEYVHDTQLPHQIHIVSLMQVFHHTDSEDLRDVHHDLLTPPPKPFC